MLRVSTLSWLDRCARRLWLDANDDTPPDPTPAPAAVTHAVAGLQHERETLRGAFGPLVARPRLAWPEEVTLTCAALARGEAVLLTAALEGEIAPDLALAGRPDALVRYDVPSAFGAWAYLPVEIKAHGAGRPADQLQLDLYRVLLARLQGVLPPGELWLGGEADHGRPATVIRCDHPPRVDEVVNRLRLLLDSTDPPPAWFSRQHCPYCPRQDACMRRVVDDMELAGLPDLHPATAHVLRTAWGITSILGVARMRPETLRRLPHVGSHAARLHATARAISLGRPVPIPPAPHPEPRALPGPRAATHQQDAPPLYLDLETDGADVWAFGLALGSEPVRVILVAPYRLRDHAEAFTVAGVPVTLVRTQHAGWQAVQAAVRDAGAVVHWGNHERRFVAAVTDPRIRDALLPRLTDAATAFGATVALPIMRSPTEGGRTMKAVGAYLGIAWPDAARSYHLPAQAFHQWRRPPLPPVRAAVDDAVLADPVAYLSADVRALRAAWEWFATFEREGHA